jgi:probable rRNA maturation factor
MHDDPNISVQYAMTADGIPGEDSIRQWATLALEPGREAAELSVRVVDEAEITALNRQYRGKDSATNVLSFPFEGLAGVDSALLGDVVICAPVVATEAVQQGKPLQAHWAHLVIHGVLHLQGYDHHADAEAQRMEAVETRLLASLGYPDPWQSGANA